MKVYTKSGDKGFTSLIGGERVSKTDIRVEAYGTVDELIAYIALLSDKLSADDVFENSVAQLRKIESELMTVSAMLAIGQGGEDKVKAISDESTERLEQEIDAMQATLPQITKFTIPGGDERVSLSHVCRTICRRAERQALRAAENCNIEEQVVVYLNRLSDYFYLLGRTITHRSNVEEILWIP
jgi:cob(I)alamin adenosyltransferase